MDLFVDPSDYIEKKAVEYYKQHLVEPTDVFVSPDVMKAVVIESRGAKFISDYPIPLLNGRISITTHVGDVTLHLVYREQCEFVLVGQKDEYARYALERDVLNVEDTVHRRPSPKDF